MVVDERHKTEPDRKHPKPYYFERRLRCPNRKCRAIYLDGASKRYFTAPAPRPPQQKKRKKLKPIPPAFPNYGWEQIQRERSFEHAIAKNDDDML